MTVGLTVYFTFCNAVDTAAADTHAGVEGSGNPTEPEFSQSILWKFDCLHAWGIFMIIMVFPSYLKWSPSPTCPGTTFRAPTSVLYVDVPLSNTLPMFTYR